MDINERLEQILNEKDDKIDSLEREIEKYKDKEQQDEWQWRQIKEIPENSKLPVPRLELRYNSTGYTRICDYGLVYRFQPINELHFVPISSTKISGEGGLDAPLDTPFRDGVRIWYDMVQLNLPGFVTDGKRARAVLKERGDGEIQLGGEFNI